MFRLHNFWPNYKTPLEILEEYAHLTLWLINKWWQLIDLSNENFLA